MRAIHGSQGFGLGLGVLPSAPVFQALGFGLNYAFEFPVSSACRQHSMTYISQRPQNLLFIYHLSILLVLFLWRILSNTRAEE